MKPIRLLIATLILTTIPSKFFGQQIIKQNNQFVYQSHYGESQVFTSELYKSGEGSPFFYPNALQGTIRFYNFDVFDSVPVLLNLYTNEIAYINSSKGDTITVKKKYVHQLEIYSAEGNQLFESINIHAGSGKNPEYRYVEVLFKGKKYALYRNITCKLVNNSIHPKDWSRQSAAFIRQDSYLLLNLANYTIESFTKLKQIKKYLAKHDESFGRLSAHKVVNDNDRKSLLELLSQYETLVD